ncbi:hypothetical protein AMK59_1920, partial [Oryctes borbonicus]
MHAITPYFDKYLSHTNNKLDKLKIFLQSHLASASRNKKKTMVRAWFMNNDSAVDQREEHHLDPPKYVSLEELQHLTGVEYFNLNVDTYATDGVLEKIKKARGYTFEDELVCSKECLPNYEEKLKIFYTEHLHTDEEIRFCVEGSGYFDVRDKND